MRDPYRRVGYGDPETVVLLPNGESFIGLRVHGLLDLTMLGIREDAEGRPVSCAVVTEIAMDVPAQNQRRYPKAWPIGKDEE